MNIITYCVDVQVGRLLQPRRTTIWSVNDERKVVLFFLLIGAIQISALI